MDFFDMIKAAALYNKISNDGLCLRLEDGKLRGEGPPFAHRKWRAKILANKDALKQLLAKPQ